MKSNAIASLSVLITAFLLFTLFNNLTLGTARIDLTENKLYTLSDGTKQIIDELDEPVNLYFFFSGRASEDLTSLRAYAQRVQEMLEEYALIADGQINLRIIDPAPFSEDEDQAAAFGLQGIPVNQSGEELYFGLAGTNAVDGEAVIPFFQPEREAFLEYELTKLIHSLAVQNRPKIGVFSGLPIDRSLDPTSYQSTPAWVFLKQLRELFQIEMLPEINADALKAIDLLMVIHPKGLEEAQLFAIDQHVMRGGKLVAFVDPLAEMDQPATPGMAMPGGESSDLNRLTAAWGVSLRSGEVLGDPDIALLVGDAAGRPIRHLGILGFTGRLMSADDVVTAPLEVVNMSTAGILDVDEVDGIKATPLIVSSEKAGSLHTMQFQFLSDPAELQQGFSPAGSSFITGVRLSGRATSAFEEAKGEAAPFIRETGDMQVVIIADTDLLSDRLWVQVQDFFGQQIASAFADNGSLVSNLVDNLSGSSALIDVRSRGQFSRPFEVVDRLRREAESRYLASAEDLQAQLEETEQQLSELEANRASDGLLTLTDEQEQALTRFQDEKLRIRRDLRDVRHQLDKDIEDLGALLKFLNILLAPLMITLLVALLRFVAVNRGREAAR